MFFPQALLCTGSISLDAVTKKAAFSRRRNTLGLQVTADEFRAHICPADFPPRRVKNAWNKQLFLRFFPCGTKNPPRHLCTLHLISGYSGGNPAGAAGGAPAYKDTDAVYRQTNHQTDQGGQQIGHDHHGAANDQKSPEKHIQIRPDITRYPGSEEENADQCRND
jgi:hypothetical protein